MLKGKLANKVMASASVFTMGISMIAPTVLAAPAETTDKAGDQSTVTAQILTGGMDLAVAGNTKATNTTFLGDLVINSPIENKTTTDLITVTDHTGAEGWNLSVKADNFKATEQTLAVGFTVDGFERVDLTDETARVADGESQLNKMLYDGTFDATWGHKPLKGDYTSNLTWTLVPNTVVDSGE